MEGFESRQCNKTIGHNKKVAQYLVNRLKTYGIENARIDSFWVSIPSHWLVGNVNQYMYNVLGTLKGTGKTDSTVIIGAHLDAIAITPNYLLTETAPGANDNATGCAIMLEMARIIYENNLQPYHNIDFMAYDAEEIGLCGSYYGKSHQSISA
jgi:leucyl aminopeptidase